MVDELRAKLLCMKSCNTKYKGCPMPPIWDCTVQLASRRGPGHKHQQVKKKELHKLMGNTSTSGHLKGQGRAAPSLSLRQHFSVVLDCRKWWAQVLSLTSFSYWYSPRPNNGLHGLLICPSRAFATYLCIFAENTETVWEVQLAYWLKEKSIKIPCLKFRLSFVLAALN